MENCSYYAPTEVIFGKDTEKQTGALVKKWGGSRVLVHYGSQSAVKSGLLDRILKSLEDQGLSAFCLGGVVPNPRLSKVREGISLGREKQIDFILAVGGGSVIDSAKGIGYGLANSGDVWDFYAKKRQAQACLPVGAVLTIAAAGSEMSNSSVLTNEEGWLKRGYSSDLGRCKFAVMNPELTYSLPAYQTASGCADILMHTLERYFTNEDRLDITDSLSEGLLRSVVKNARILKDNPLDYGARASIMWSGSLSHNDLTHFGSGRGDWACHQLEHELGGMFDVAHGAGLAALWGTWARYVVSSNPSRFARYARRVWDVSEADDLKAALAGIAATETFFREIGMPVSLEELGLSLTQEQIETLSWKCSYENTRTIGDIRRLSLEDIRKIYRTA